TGFFLRGPAPGPGHGRGRRRDEGHRHRRHRWDALRHIHRPLLHPPALCARIAHVQGKAAGSTARAPRRPHHFRRGTSFMIRNALTTILTVICLAGCTMAPIYSRPVPPIPADWPTGPAYKGADDGRTGPQAADVGWRQFYADERLQQVILLALKN